MNSKEKQILLKHFCEAQKRFKEQSEIKQTIVNDRFPMLPQSYIRAEGEYIALLRLVKALGLVDLATVALLVND